MLVLLSPKHPSLRLLSPKRQGVHCSLSRGRNSKAARPQAEELQPGHAVQSLEEGCSRPQSPVIASLSRQWRSLPSQIMAIVQRREASRAWGLLQVQHCQAWQDHSLHSKLSVLTRPASCPHYEPPTFCWCGHAGPAAFTHCTAGSLSQQQSSHQTSGWEQCTAPAHRETGPTSPHHLGASYAQHWLTGRKPLQALGRQTTAMHSLYMPATPTTSKPTLVMQQDGCTHSRATCPCPALGSTLSTSSPLYLPSTGTTASHVEPHQHNQSLQGHTAQPHDRYHAIPLNLNPEPRLPIIAHHGDHQKDGANDAVEHSD